MSDAKVKFYDQHMSGEVGRGIAARFGFACPKRPGARCSGLLIAGRTSIKRDGQGQNGGQPQWDMVNDNPTAPTFSPSVNCGVCTWHGYIENGRAVDCAKKDEPEPQPPVPG